ncbi:MAG: hypothetical protein JW915_09105 [Chitinispirillaceae bacterium]|nr:hypothetical protein [Chitinispirillaceae bacterium]
MSVVFIIMFAVVAIVAIEKFSEIYQTRLKLRQKDSFIHDASELNRINRMEERIANLEAIIIKSEREKKFKDLEKDT